MDKITAVIYRHLLLSLQMLSGIIDRCPDALWVALPENKSIGKRVLHVLESIDFWLDDFSEYTFTKRFENLSPEMDSINNVTVSKVEISAYLPTIAAKILCHFDQLTDTKLAETSQKHSAVTHLDIILSQIRHIQLNIGYCNQIFKSNGILSIEWIGYHEEN